MKYHQPYGIADSNASYQNGDPSIGKAGSIPDAQTFENPQREIINALLAAGLVPSDLDLTQLTQAIKLLGRIPFCQDIGSQNHLVINPIPVVTAYTVPLILAVEVAFASTAACDINVSGLGAIPLVRIDGSPLVTNDLVTGGIILIAYDGARFELISVPGSLQYPTPDKLWHYAVDTSNTANIINVSIEAAITSWILGLPIAVKVANANTGATTLIMNGLAPVPVTRGSGTPLLAGDVAAGYVALVIWDGAECQLLNPQTAASGGGSGNDITGPDRPYWLAVNSYQVTSPPGSPSLGDTYLIPATGATGSWSGLGGRLSQWNGTAWVYRAYPAGSIVGTSDTLRYYENIGGNVWVEIQMLTLGKLFFYGQL